MEVKMGKKKIKSHIICKKAPILVMILLPMVLLFIRDLTYALGWEITSGSVLLDNLYNIAVSLLVLFLIKRWFSPSYRVALLEV
jgi:uncharacterized membrane protein